MATKLTTTAATREFPFSAAVQMMSHRLMIICGVVGNVRHSVMLLLKLLRRLIVWVLTKLRLSWVFGHGASPKAKEEGEAGTYSANNNNNNNNSDGDNSGGIKKGNGGVAPSRQWRVKRARMLQMLDHIDQRECDERRGCGERSREVEREVEK